MKCLNFFLILTLFYLAVSDRVSIRVLELDNYQVEVFDWNGEIYMEAINLQSGDKHGPVHIYEGLDRVFIDTYISGDFVLEGEDDDDVYIRPPVLTEAVRMREAKQSSDEKKINLLNIENEKRKKEIEDLITRIVALEAALVAPQ